MALQSGKRITLFVAELAIELLLVDYRGSGFMDFKVTFESSC